MVFAVCEPTIDYENGRSEMASKYVAGLSIFSFLWAAYEATVGLTAPNEHRRLLNELRFGERGRKLFESRPTLSIRFEGLSDLCKLAEHHCKRGGLMGERVDKMRSKYAGRDFVFAAEMSREFRNFVFHGQDSVPAHEDWGDSVESRARLARFYSVGRLVLLSIQALVVSFIEESGWQPSAAEDDDEYRDPLSHLLTLHCLPRSD